MSVEFDLCVLDVFEQFAICEASVGSRMDDCGTGGIMAGNRPENGQVGES